MSKKVLMLTVIISLIGLIMVYSASNIWANYKYNDSLYYIKRQFIFFVIGMILMIVISKIDYHIYEKYHRVILFLSLIMMMIVLIPGIGVVRNGSRSWFYLGLFALQPSEVFKLGILIYCATYISRYYHYLKKIRYVLPMIFFLGLGFILIMMQPDFGSGIVIVCSVMVMIIASPFPFRYIMILIGTGVLGMIMMILSAPYRLKRILAFIDPFQDPLGSGFQAIQALFSISPGGLIGSGFNHSIQKHFYLPEPQTDFIFAIFLEEFGLIGGIIVVTMYLSLFWLGYKIASLCHDLFGCFLTIGIISMIAIQTFINFGVVLGLLPVTGITAPLMSYGGTSLIVTLASIGIVLNISKSL